MEEVTLGRGRRVFALAGVWETTLDDLLGARKDPVAFLLRQRLEKPVVVWWHEGGEEVAFWAVTHAPSTIDKAAAPALPGCPQHNARCVWWSSRNAPTTAGTTCDDVLPSGE